MHRKPTNSQQPCSWVSISGPGPGATFHGRENPEHLAVEPVEPVEPVALEPSHFLNPRNFWNQLNAWGSTGSKHSLGSNTRNSTGSTHVPHRFHMGSTRPLVPQVPDRFNHAMVPHIPHRFLGFNHLLVPQVPDSFLGFNRGTVRIVEGVNFSNCPNYVALNAPLRRTIFGMGGDVFLTGMPFTNRNHATGSTGPKQIPWVQPRHWFHSSRQVLRVETRNGSTSSRQFPWVQQRH